MQIYKSYEAIPIQCRICKHFLQDDDFIDDHATKYVCSFDDEINPNLIGFGCEEFKIGKHNLVEFLQYITAKEEVKD